MTAGARYRWLAGGMGSLAVLVVCSVVRPEACAPALVALAASLPTTDDPCAGGAIGVAQVLDGMRVSRACARALLAGRWSGPAVRTVARDEDQPFVARLSAAAAVMDAGGGTNELGLLFLDPSLAPAERREAGRMAAWEPADVPLGLHGARDLALLRTLARAGEGDVALAARMFLADPDFPGARAAVEAAVGVPPGGAGRLIGERIGEPGIAEAVVTEPCGRDCDARLARLLATRGHSYARGAIPEPLATEGPGGVGQALVLLQGGDELLAEHVEQEIGEVSGWIAKADAPRRLASAVASSRAGARGRDPHAVLARGAGAPGLATWLARELAARAHIPLDVFWDGEALWWRAGSVSLRLDACLAPRAGEVPAGAAVVPPGGDLALALAEAAGNSLRSGDDELARDQARAARAAARRTTWDPPALGALEEIIARLPPGTDGAGTAALLPAEAGLAAWWAWTRGAPGSLAPPRPPRCGPAFLPWP